MKKIILFNVILFYVFSLYGQRVEKQYSELIKKADSFYRIKEYKRSGYTYSNAFKSNNWKGSLADRYNAACSWSMAGYKDSAFGQLYLVAKVGIFTNYNHITKDSDLVPLYQDARWQDIIDIILLNKKKPIISTLDSINDEITAFYIKEDSIAKLYGLESRERKDFYSTRSSMDSVHQIKVSFILDNYGWLGPEVIGEDGNRMFYVVILEASLSMKEKYAPMMYKAVLEGKANPQNYASLKDGILLGQGRKQMYGSRIAYYMKDGQYVPFLRPLKDPDHVDARRGSIGLSNLAEYLIQYKIVWDLEQYKNDYPEK